MEQGRKYTFSWNHIGDIADGRPNLGNTASVEAYRLMQFSCRDVMEQYLGTEKPMKYSIKPVNWPVRNSIITCLLRQKILMNSFDNYNWLYWN